MAAFRAQFWLAERLRDLSTREMAAPSLQAHSCRSPRPSRNVSEEVTHGSSRKNRLLKKKGSVHPERKHIHMLAAAVLEVLIRLTPRKSGIWAEDSRKRDSAANKIALHISKWPSMQAQRVTGQTVIAWRNQQRSLSKGDRKPFDTLVRKILNEPNPQQTVERLLRNGPPGHWKS
jgi:hypothetical protein